MCHRAVLVAAAITAVTGCQTPEPADLILTNGNVITVDAERPQAEALAIKGDRILAVGSNREIEAYRGVETRVIDLGGETAVPGLIDAHLHFPRLGKRTKQLFLDETRSPEEAMVIVREQVESAEPGEWITGRGWHTVTWGSGYPDNEALSAISPENPVFLIGMASHAVWVNAKALELAGINKDTPDPGGGRILRHPGTREPTHCRLPLAAFRVPLGVSAGARRPVAYRCFWRARSPARRPRRPRRSQKLGERECRSPPRPLGRALGATRRRRIVLAAIRSAQRHRHYRRRR